MPVLYRWEISAPFQDLNRALPIRIAFSHHIGLLGLLPKVMRHDTAQPLEPALPLRFIADVQCGLHAVVVPAIQLFLAEAKEELLGGILQIHFRIVYKWLIPARKLHVLHRLSVFFETTVPGIVWGKLGIPAGRFC